MKRYDIYNSVAVFSVIRELVIAEQNGHGLTNKEIEKLTELSDSTVNDILANLGKKVLKRKKLKTRGTPTYNEIKYDGITELVATKYIKMQMEVLKLFSCYYPKVKLKKIKILLDKVVKTEFYKQLVLYYFNTPEFKNKDLEVFGEIVDRIKIPLLDAPLPKKSVIKSKEKEFLLVKQLRKEINIPSDLIYENYVLYIKSYFSD